MQYAALNETLGDLAGWHRGAVVAHGAARQASLQEGLRQTVWDVFRSLAQILLQRADQPGAVERRMGNDFNCELDKRIKKVTP